MVKLLTRERRKEAPRFDVEGSKAMTRALLAISMAFLVASCDIGSRPSAEPMRIQPTLPAVNDLPPIGPSASATLTPVPTSEDRLPPNMLPDEMTGKDLSGFVDAWKWYENSTLGFAFEYPAIYDEIDFCRPFELQIETEGAAIQVGSRIQVIVEPVGDQAIDEYISDLTDGEDQVRIIPTPLAGRDGYYVEYRYGGLGRLQTIYIADIESLRATFALTGPWICDFYQVNVFESIAFDRILRTFTVVH